MSTATMRRIIDITVSISEAPPTRYHNPGDTIAETTLRASEELFDTARMAAALSAVIEQLLTQEPAPVALVAEKENAA